MTKPHHWRDLSGRITKDGDVCFAFGTSADLWKGKWVDTSKKDQLAIKVIRTLPHEQSQDFERMKLKLKREASILCRLHHPHIIPFYGISFDFDRQDTPSLVYPFFKSGDIVSYLKAFPQTNRLELICQVASGLAYLHDHSPPVVHGDIKGSNILIDDSGKACLSDFGLGRLVEARGFTTKHVGGTCRWMAYELVCDDGDELVKLTTQSDIWAFGMTILEILTGKLPFSHLNYDTSVIFYVVKNRKPHQPPEVGGDLWAFLGRCWDQDPQKRPNANVVALYLNLLFMKPLKPKEGERLLGLLLSEYGLDNIPNKHSEGNSNLALHCNWGSCTRFFSTLQLCQEHEQEHWGSLLQPT
ncbi:hypothetical protein AX15_003384 [Amanita polypyramis BW_CC]|nr:hypothetical protein AX15_003384 [Amanita polypyramis BW_CC]